MFGETSYNEFFFNSVFKISIILSYFVPLIKTLVSSANKMAKSKSEALEKSFM